MDDLEVVKIFVEAYYNYSNTREALEVIKPIISKDQYNRLFSNLKLLQRCDLSEQ